MRNFVHCVAGTAGGRLARWLQPESYVDVDQCRLNVEGDGGCHCHWPTTINVVTCDQYADTVQVQNLKVEVKAVPIDSDLMNTSSGGRKLRRAEVDGMTFGGQKPPNLEPKYEVTVKDKMFYHAITVQKCFDNYSFEELRYASPALRRPSENMLVRANNDGSYSATWTPSNTGWFQIHVTVDDCELPETLKLEVRDPPQGVAPPPPPLASAPCNKATSRSAAASKAASKKAVESRGLMSSRGSGFVGGGVRTRKFTLKCSAGLRVRVHPTLQSEQIGLIPPDGDTITVIDELCNSDGVWVRLSQESLLGNFLSFSTAYRHKNIFTVSQKQHRCFSFSTRLSLLVQCWSKKYHFNIFSFLQ